MTVSTARLKLDRLSVVDFDAMWSIYADPLTNEFNPDGPLTRMAAQRMFGQWLGQWHDHGFGYWTVRDEEGVIGFSGIRFGSWDDRTVLNLTYRLTPRAWGRGFATEGRRPRWTSGVPSTPRIRSSRTRSRATSARSARRSPWDWSAGRTSTTPRTTRWATTSCSPRAGSAGHLSQLRQIARGRSGARAAAGLHARAARSCLSCDRLGEARLSAARGSAGASRGFRAPPPSGRRAVAWRRRRTRRSRGGRFRARPAPGRSPPRRAAPAPAPAAR